MNQKKNPINGFVALKLSFTVHLDSRQVLQGIHPKFIKIFLKHPTKRNEKCLIETENTTYPKPRIV